MKSLCLAFALVLTSGTSFGQTAKLQSLPAPKIDMPAEGVTVPMKHYGGRPVVEAKLNGKGPYRFYLDTGASGPVIGETLAKELQLETIGEVQVKSGGDGPDKKPIPARMVRINQLEIGSAKLETVVVAAMDRIRLERPDSPAGVLSPSMFHGCLVTMDYPKKEIHFHSGQLPNADNKTIFDYLPDGRIPSLMIQVGDERIEANLDTGSGGGLSLPTKVAEKLPLHGKPKETGKKARSVSGDFPVFEGKLKGTCTFGQFTLTDPKIDFSDVVRHANLGSEILARFTVTVDVKNRRFQLCESAPGKPAWQAPEAQ